MGGCPPTNHENGGPSLPLPLAKGSCPRDLISFPGRIKEGFVDPGYTFLRHVDPLPYFRNKLSNFNDTVGGGLNVKT